MIPELIKDPHPQYGKISHRIKVVKRNPWAALGLLFFTGLFIAGYMHKGPEAYSNIETIFFYLFTSSLFILACFHSFIVDREDIRLILYENGIWSHKKVCGSENNFILWKDINSFDENYHQQSFIKYWHINIHPFDKDKFDDRISALGKFVFSPKIKPKSYQQIQVTNALDISCDELLALLNEELENWRKRANSKT